MRSAIDDLMIITADIPSFLHSFDCVKDLPSDHVPEQRVGVLHDEIEDIIQRLSRWRVSVASQISYRLEPSKLLYSAPIASLKGIFPQQRQYSSLEAAKMEIVYSSIQLAAHLERLSLATFTSSRRIPKDPKQKSASAHVDITHVIQDANFHASTILESLEFFMKDQTGILAMTPNLGNIMLVMIFFQIMDDPRAEIVSAMVDAYQARTAVPLASLVREAVEKACEGRLLK